MNNTFCGKKFTQEDFELIRNIIRKNPKESRFSLSKIICKTFRWYKANGGFKDMSCRVAMLKMHRAGLIQLPDSRVKNYRAQSRIERTFFSEPGVAISKSVNELNKINIELIKSTTSSKIWNEFIDRYHYLGYVKLPGAQLRYLFSTDNQYLGAIGFGAAAWKVAPRDSWIGWNEKQRKEKLYLIINNARFLILPWISCRNLATKILSSVSKRIVNDWYERYHYRPVLLETFVEIQKFQGTCYKAANWINVGLTKGRGRMDKYKLKNKPVKSIWLYPLSKLFREELTK